MSGQDHANAIAAALHLRPGFVAEVAGTGLLIQHPEGFTCSIIKLMDPRELPTTEELFERVGAIRWKMFSTWEPPGRA